MARESRNDDEGLAQLESALGFRFRNKRYLLQALTHRSHSAESSREATEGDNEKLEFLGDAVLGMIVSEDLVREFPDWSEGQLSKSRSRLVNEGSLAEAARRLDLGSHLRLGRGEEKTGGREKPALLADAFEAILGAIYMDSGLEPAQHFVRRGLLDGVLENEDRRQGYSDSKSSLQEELQAKGQPAASYRVVEEKGPDHRKVFLVEVRAGKAIARGYGTSKKEAEQAAARALLGSMETVPADSSAEEK